MTIPQLASSPTLSSRVYSAAEQLPPRVSSANRYRTALMRVENDVAQIIEFENAGQTFKNLQLEPARAYVSGQGGRESVLPSFIFF